MRATVLFSILVGFVSQYAAGQYHPLPVPTPLYGPSYDLHVQEGSVQLVPGFDTPTYGVNGPILGPTIVASYHDSVSIAVYNELPTTTTMHWHGLHVPAFADGGPHQIIASGGEWNPHFAINNRAGTYWYHPHGEGKTDFQVSHGIAGFFLIHDSTEKNLGLPLQYGIDDFPIVVQTKSFDEFHQISIADEMDTLLLVNGVSHAQAKLPAQVVRLRLLNGSSMRTYLIGNSDNRPMYLIATDDGLLARTISVNRVRIAPGERVEILLDNRGREGNQFDLVNYGNELTSGIYGSASVGMGMATIPGYSSNPLNGKKFGILNVVVGSRTNDPVMNIPAQLVQQIAPKISDVVQQRQLTFTPETMSMDKMVVGPFLINGARFSMDVVNIAVQLNTTEIWSLVNRTSIAHPFHIHNQSVYLLDRDGVQVGEEERGPKDVMLVMPGQTLRFITKFEDYANPTIPYMYHCHMLHHEDDGMMGSFVIVDPAATTHGDYHLKSTDRCWPSPCTEYCRISSADMSSSQINAIEVSDIIGNKTTLEYSIVDEHTIQIQTDQLSPGLFFCRFTSGQMQFTATVLKGL